MLPSRLSQEYISADTLWRLVTCSSPACLRARTCSNVSCGSLLYMWVCEPDNAPEPPPRVVCTVCGRDFAWNGDMARHKCLEVRARPVSEQRGASQCGRCGQ